MKSITSILAVLLVGLFLVACGRSTSPKTEAGLQGRAEATALAASSANQKDHPWDIWKDVYGFVAMEFRDRCGPDSEFGLNANSNLQGLMGEAAVSRAIDLDGAVVGRTQALACRSFPTAGLSMVQRCPSS